MWTRRIACILAAALALTLAACASSINSPSRKPEGQAVMNAQQIKQALVGNWVSMSGKTALVSGPAYVFVRVGSVFSVPAGAVWPRRGELRTASGGGVNVFAL